MVLHTELEPSTTVRPTTVEGRTPRQLAWERLRRDKAALLGFAFVVLILLAAIFAPFLTGISHNDPYKFVDGVLDPNGPGQPAGRFGGVSTKHWFGVEPTTGRDVFSLMVYGLRTSLTFAIFATFVGVGLGVVVGLVGGYYGGTIDAVTGWVNDLLLVFPFVLFVIAISPVIEPMVENLGIKYNNTAKLTVLIIIVGLFEFPYFSRIIRGLTLSLREREFVDAARSLGASNRRILFREILPNLAAPILVYTMLTLPTNIGAEAALSFLGVGVIPPTASLGGVLNTAADWYTVDPTFMIIPGVLLLLAVMAFNLLGDGLRDAIDPKSLQ